LIVISFHHVKVLYICYNYTRYSVSKLQAKGQFFTAQRYSSLEVTTNIPFLLRHLWRRRVYEGGDTPPPPRGLAGPLEPLLNLSAMNIGGLYSSGVMIRIKIIYE